METRIDLHTELLLAARTAHVRRDWQCLLRGFRAGRRDISAMHRRLDALAIAAWQLGRGKE